jgi:GT2 family glycosyltransferase
MTSTADLAVVIVSTNEANWLQACLPTLYEHAGGARLDVVVVDNESTDGTRELVEGDFPDARVVRCLNRGFAHANNRGLMTVNAPFVLFLNPDTEIVEGTFAELLTHLTGRPAVGLVGVRQVTGEGDLYPTIRRFPSVSRLFFDALAAEKLPFRTSWMGERELDMSVYEHEVPCDWTSGSFMLARREAIQGAGYLDERFFIYAEETDLCRRIVDAGWEIRHFPYMTIVHHAGKKGFDKRFASQDAYARRQYLDKHFGPGARAFGIAALALRYGLRATITGRDRDVSAARRDASREALATLLGRRPPPFGEPPGQSVPQVGDEPL